MSLSDSRRCRRPEGGVEAATLAATGLPRYPDHLPDVPCPVPRWIERVRCRFFPVHTAFPVSLAGRHPRLHFRGLLRLHSRYGPPGCSTAQGGLCHEASARQVALPNRSSATRPIDYYLGGFFLHWCSVPSGHTAKSGATCPLAPPPPGFAALNPGYRLTRACGRKFHACRTCRRGPLKLEAPYSNTASIGDRSRKG
jgi:hypothetical protein